MASNSSGLLSGSCGQVYFFAANFVVYLCALPVFLAVLFVGCQRRRKRRSGPVAVATNHTDVLTYNMVALELTGMLAVLLFLCGAFTNRPFLSLAAAYLGVATFPGVNLFHVLTCGERYLAVVHPVAYLRLKGRGGVRVRNLCVGGAWLLCGAWPALLPVGDLVFRLTLCIEACALLAVSFCCVAVLRALIRPAPGDRGGTGSDQSKKRALHAMTAVMGAVLLRFLLNGVSYSVVVAAPNSYLQCLVSMSIVSFQVPSSLVLPLLYLQRARKLAACCRRRRRRRQSDELSAGPGTTTAPAQNFTR